MSADLTSRRSLAHARLDKQRRGRPGHAWNFSNCLSDGYEKWRGHRERGTARRNTSCRKVKHVVKLLLSGAGGTIDYDNILFAGTWGGD